MKNDARIAVLATLSLAAGPTIATAEIGAVRLFVDETASGAGDGLSWATAYQHLQPALEHARTNPEVFEIWVARGTYEPDEGGGNQNLSSELVSEVAVYSGFAGDETSLGQRDIEANPTILSGDLLENDQPAFTNYSDNSRIVVGAQGTSEGTRLDGFTIRGALGNQSAGHGVRIEMASVAVVNCSITENWAISNTAAGV